MPSRASLFACVVFLLVLPQPVPAGSLGSHSENAVPASPRTEFFAIAEAAPQGEIPPHNPACAIKGNINRKGERIYHTPAGDPDYLRTQMDTARGERWFCTEAEAVAAGWRPSKRISR